MLATVYAACRALSLNPGLIIASWSYRTVRVHRLWRALSPNGLNLIARVQVVLGVILVLGLALARARQGALDDANTLVLATIGYLSLIAFAIREPQGQPRQMTTSRISAAITAVT